MRKTFLAATIALMIPWLAGDLVAREHPTADAAALQHKQHHPQPAPDVKKPPAATMEACQTMMTAQKHLGAEMDAMDAAFTDLVARMNAASGTEKLEAAAAVLTELAKQRTRLREKMTAMQSGMMGPMMDHMASGMSGRAKESMMSCPMMKEMGGMSQPREEGKKPSGC